MVKIGRESKTLMGHMAPRELETEQVRRLVRQAIDRAAKAERDTILRVALLNAGEEDIPDDSARLTAFVLGGLHDAIVEFVDDKAAASIVKSLRPLLKMKSELDLEEEEVAEVDVTAAGIRHRVLVVDDDVRVRAQLVGMLSAAGFQAASTPDANVALAICVRQRPDAIVAEVNSEAMSGTRLLALLRVAFGLDAPLLVLLAGDDVEVEESGSGVTTIAKPPTKEALLAALEALQQ